MKTVKRSKERTWCTSHDSLRFNHRESTISVLPKDKGIGYLVGKVFVPNGERVQTTFNMYGKNITVFMSDGRVLEV